MSLKIKDLRLFNLLEVDGVIIQVGKIEENHISWNLSKNDKLRVWKPFLPINDERIKPIPITEEWLLKFGFEDKGACFNLSRKNELGHHFGDFAVSKYDNTQMKVWRGDRYIGVCILQYVHQLQNLYFSLTGDELTLNK